MVTAVMAPEDTSVQNSAFLNIVVVVADAATVDGREDARKEMNDSMPVELKEWLGTHECTR